MSLDKQNEEFLGGVDSSHDGNIGTLDGRKDGLARDSYEFQAQSSENFLQDKLSFSSGCKRQPLMTSHSLSMDEEKSSIEPAQAI